jgi:hypothetical protein
MEITKEILDRLDAIALKIGTTGEHLWEVLTKQGMVEGVFGLIGVVVVPLLFYIMIKTVLKYKDVVEEENAEGPVLFFCFIISLILFGLFIFSVIGVQYLFNPEYYALKTILK